MKLKLTLLAIFLFAQLSYAASAGKVNISPSGFVGQPRVTVRIDVVIEKNKDNRSATLFFYSEDYYSSSSFPLDGENAPTLYNFTRPDLGAGTYYAEVVIERLSGGKWKEVRIEASQTLTVL